MHGFASLKKGMFVRVKSRGVIGMVESFSARKATIKFGADGPRDAIWRYDLAPASPHEVKEAGYEGVGHVALS